MSSLSNFSEKAHWKCPHFDQLLSKHLVDLVVKTMQEVSEKAFYALLEAHGWELEYSDSAWIEGFYSVGNFQCAVPTKRSDNWIQLSLELLSQVAYWEDLSLQSLLDELNPNGATVTLLKSDLQALVRLALRACGNIPSNEINALTVAEIQLKFDF